MSLVKRGYPWKATACPSHHDVVNALRVEQLEQFFDERLRRAPLLDSDMRQNLQDVARVATGVSSTYAVSAKPASATLRVAIGLPGHGRVVPRRRHRRSERIDEHPDRVQRAHGSGRHGSGAWFRSGSS